MSRAKHSQPPPAANDPLPSWRDGAARAAITRFIERVTDRASPDFVPPPERIAVFDNDGTLWCEKPMPIELGFILERLAMMATNDPSLRAKQPWKAAFEKDYAWLGEIVTKHYRGDDSDMKTLLGGLLRAFDGLTVEAYAAAADSFLRHHTHPRLARPFVECAYTPMLELLRTLESAGFHTYIASGGDRDFMRTVTEDVYGIPPERVIGTSSALRFHESPHGADLIYLAKLDVFDDGPTKPVRIWSRVGERPVVAVGNSNGDIEMLKWAGGAHPALRILVQHDDERREFDYTAGAERVLALAEQDGWVIVSMANDWRTIFGERPAAKAGVTSAEVTA